MIVLKKYYGLSDGLREYLESTLKLLLTIKQLYFLIDNVNLYFFIVLISSTYVRDSHAFRLSKTQNFTSLKKFLFESQNEILIENDSQ